MGVYISLSSKIGGSALIGAWALKRRNTVIVTFQNNGHTEFAIISPKLE